MIDDDLAPSRHELLCARINLIVSSQNSLKRASIEARQELDRFAQEDGLHVPNECQDTEAARGAARDSESQKAESAGAEAGATEGPSQGQSQEDQAELESASACDMSQSRSVARKLFHKIALRTHPDKVKDPLLTRLFLRAKRSNLIELCIILCKVDYSSFLLLTEDDLDLISEELRKQEASMNNDSTLGHLWSSMSPQKKKEYYMTHIKSKLQKIFTKK